MGWETKIKDRNLLVCNDVTYGHFKTCIHDLTAYNGEEAFDVRRTKVGLLCLHGPGYKTNENNELSEIAMEVFGANGEDWSVHSPGFKSNELSKIAVEQDLPVHKAIRLEMIGIKGEVQNITWPFWNDVVQDEFVVIRAENVVMLCLHFEGDNCQPWSDYECKNHVDTIAQAFRMLHLSPNLAKKIQKGALSKKRKRKKPG